MQLEFHQLDRRWEHLRVHHPGRQRRLLASLAESGQQTPIVVVAAEGQTDRYAARRGQGRVRPGHAQADLFIHPGFEFQVISGLMTNFHLPKSSLLMLVAAFAGRERLLAAYAEAVAQRYRFYSYGDAMLVI